MSKLALGIETSCDDTCVSIVNDKGQVMFHETQNQDQVHKEFKGIVPELASRNHQQHLVPLIQKALDVVPKSNIDLITVTNRPGLLGSLLVGYMTAQTLSLVWKKPLIGVNHIEAHVFSPFLEHEAGIEYPFLSLIASGGHTQLFKVNNINDSLLLGQTLDDSAGEAFDKLAQMLGLPWPGGPKIEKLASPSCSQKFFSEIQTPELNFSFSGLKSQARRKLNQENSSWVKKHQGELACDYQDKIVSHLLEKLTQAYQQHPVRHIAIGGGVSANTLLRDRLQAWCKSKNITCYLPKKIYSTDNASMVAFTGLQYFKQGLYKKDKIKCSPRHLKQDFFNLA